jgi:hypothetical protein
LDPTSSANKIWCNFSQRVGSTFFFMKKCWFNFF